MAQQLITRIRPAHLQQVQAQTTTDAAVSDVILSLQSAISTEPAPLNTLCPTCSVQGAQLGFLPFTFNDNTYHTLCPTCKGYALIYTADGQLTPPVNPFRSTLTVIKLLPADLIEALAAFPESTTLDLLITSLQGNIPDGAPTRDNDCPTCAVDDVSIGWLTKNNNKILCYTCAGYQKIVYQIPPEQPEVTSLPFVTWSKS